MMSNKRLTQWQLLTGRNEPPPEQRPLRAGPLTMVFESGDLRYLKLGGREVIRRMYAAVRDQNWGTAPGEISDLKFESAKECFRITYTSTHRQNNVHFVWQAEIIGQPDGTIRFNFDGTAKSTFLRNRIGFCVLHPIRECAGAKCRALYLNGTDKEMAFPEIIALEQPVRWLHDLSGLAHEIEPGVWAELRFEGDAFEMEDQRNWIDASFKTFCTPLRVPYPLEIKTGTRVRQNMTLRLLAPASRLQPESAGETSAPLNNQGAVAPSPATVRFADASVKLPAIGLGTSSNKSPDNLPDKARLGALHLSHLRHDVRLALPGWGQELRSASLEAAALNLPLELAVHLPVLLRGELAELAAWLTESSAHSPQRRYLARILVFQEGEKSTTRAALEAARGALANLATLIGAGTNADLYQLNLQRPPADAEFICWSMNPQVHAFDNASIAETPEAAAQQIASVRKYFPGKPIVVSPVTLKPRFNPVATGPEPSVSQGELPSQVDPRQMSLFGAVWTLAMIKALAEGGVESMTLFETTGWRGVMETAAGSLLPEKFPSMPDAVFPLYHVLADIGEFAGGAVSLTTSSEPRAVQSLMLVHEQRRRLLLANLQPCPTQVELTGIERPFFLRRLNADTAERAMREPKAFRNSGETVPVVKSGFSILLAPYELVTLDFA